jgi:hypothetical protein
MAIVMDKKYMKSLYSKNSKKRKYVLVFLNINTLDITNLKIILYI